MQRKSRGEQRGNRKGAETEQRERQRQRRERTEDPVGEQRRSREQTEIAEMA